MGRSWNSKVQPYSFRLFREYKTLLLKVERRTATVRGEGRLQGVFDSQVVLVCLRQGRGEFIGLLNIYAYSARIEHSGAFRHEANNEPSWPS